MGGRNVVSEKTTAPGARGTSETYKWLCTDAVISLLGLRPKDINLIAENVFCTEMFVSALFNEKLGTPQNV